MSAVEAALPDAQQPTFTKGAVIAMLAAGLFSLSALAVLSSFAPDLRTGGDPRAHALSKSAVGFGGLVRLLQLEGKPVLVTRTKAAPANPDALRVLTPDDDTTAKDIAPLTTTPALVILPKWRIGGDIRNRDWVTRGGLDSAADIVKGPLSIIGKPQLGRRRGASLIPLRLAESGAPIGEVRVDDLQTISGADLKPVVVDDVGDVVLGVRTNDDGDYVYVLADPDLLNTYGLREVEGARIAERILDLARPAPGGPVFFDVTLNGYERGRNLWKLAFEPPFLAATLCALFAGILMGLQAAVRFGAERRAERAIGLGKRALADNQAGLIRMAKREGRMALPYLKLVRDRTARIVGAGQVADDARLEDLLDRLGARRTDLKISELSQDAKSVADPAGLLRLARRLYQWKLEISRERQ